MYSYFPRYNILQGLDTLLHINAFPTGSRSTFEFQSRVNLSPPRLLCIARTLVKWSRRSIRLAGATRLTWSDFRLNLLLLKGQGCVRYGTAENNRIIELFIVEFQVSQKCSIPDEIQVVEIEYQLKRNNLLITFYS